MVVDCIIEDERWAALGLEVIAERAAQTVLSHMNMDPKHFEIVLLGTNDKRIAALNSDFRGKPQATNVLSWPSEDRGAENEGAAPVLPQVGKGEPESLGDVALAYETCIAEAETDSKPKAEHVCHLIVHGILHLLGYDHLRDGDATLMEGLETEILATLGISDPYS